MNPDEKVKRLHEAYCKLSEFDLALTPMRILAWQRWSMRFNQEDLSLVIRYLKKGIADGKRNSGALRLSNLINPEDLDKFEEELAMARKVIRERKPIIVSDKKVGDTSLRVEEDPNLQPANQLSREEIADALAGFRKGLKS